MLTPCTITKAASIHAVHSFAAGCTPPSSMVFPTSTPPPNSTVNHDAPGVWPPAGS